MAEEKKDNAQPAIVPSILEEHGAAALPFHKPTAPFKSSDLRNGAFRALQKAGVKGLTEAEWIEAAEALGSTKGAVKFILRAKRRVKVVKTPDSRFVVVGPTEDGGELKLKDGVPVAPAKPRKAKKATAKAE